MGRINVFESKQYTTIMYLAILIVSLLILFNFINIFEGKEIQQENRNSLITGFATHDNNDSNKTNGGEGDGELYSGKSYFIYYMILTVLGCSIVALSFRFLVPVLRKYT